MALVGAEVHIRTVIEVDLLGSDRGQGAHDVARSASNKIMRNNADDRGANRLPCGLRCSDSIAITEGGLFPRARLQLHVQVSHKAVEIVGMHVEQLGSFRVIALRCLQSVKDYLPFRILYHFLIIA
jgi:hypothetical protein